MQVEVFNSLRTGPIYTSHIEVEYNERANAFEVYYRERVRGSASVKMLAIAEFAEFLLNGFKQPGTYRVELAGDAIAQREVL